MDKRASSIDIGFSLKIVEQLQKNRELGGATIIVITRDFR
jgi:ABC-type dipeptide/oligopeptide/nickel transport system ATPase subunit